MAAHRLGVTRVIATDVIRHVLRASFSRDLMPSVHSSAFEVDDSELHRAHFEARGDRRPAQRYLDRFEQIRDLQQHLAGKADEHRVAVIDNENIDEALGRVMELVLGAVHGLSGTEEDA